MKILKWTTTVEWVDVNTGEMLNKDIVAKEYIIIKKNKIIKKENYANYKDGTGHTKGQIRVTNYCTREGKQQSLF